VLEAQRIDRGERRGMLSTGEAPRHIRKVTLRVSKKLKEHLSQSR